MTLEESAVAIGDAVDRVAFGHLETLRDLVWLGRALDGGQEHRRQGREIQHQ